MSETTGANGEAIAEPPRRRMRRWLLAVAAILALLVFVKQCVYDVRPIVGQSMWPGLVGDRDWVLFERSGLVAGEPQRYEVWAIAAERESVGEEGHLLNRDGVKRVLALGGELVDFVAGDLFIGDHVDRMTRPTRPPAVREAMLVPVLRGSDPDVLRRWRVREGGLQPGKHGLHLKAVNEAVGTPGFLAHLLGRGDARREGIWDDHQGIGGQPIAGTHMVPDVRVDVVVAAINHGATLVIRHRIGGRKAEADSGDVREVRLRSVGLRVDGRDPSGRRFALAEETSLPGSCSLRMETLDGRFRVALLDDDRSERVVIVDAARETRDLVAYDSESEEFRIASHLSLEIDRGSVDLGALDIVRDVYYFWPPGLTEARDVREEHVFVAGDNMPASSIRQFLDVPRHRLMGRVRRVVWPRSRRIPIAGDAPGDTATKR